ncbi:MAG TPA: hypothetical protein VK427_06200 [Kofleriaceae bacterium]|nr:hypothetical protein [Kofleriaceae bacterium]
MRAAASAGKRTSAAPEADAAHTCLGAGLARIQLDAVIDALRERPIELVEPPRWFHSNVNAGFDRVLVTPRRRRR